MRRPTSIITATMASLLVLVACSSAEEGGPEQATGSPTDSGSEVGGSAELTGTIVLTSGACDGDTVVASTFRMVQPNGDVVEGPFVENGDAPCADRTYTTLEAGSTGLVLGTHQTFPDPVFDDSGHALFGEIVAPTSFFAINFGVATSRVEPQTELEVVAPSLVHDGEGGLTGDLRAISVAYNGAFFAQGSPAPDGSLPASTSPVTGTYDPATGAVTLDWSAQIVGGPFNNFTGVWHLEGTFTESA